MNGITAVYTEKSLGTTGKHWVKLRSFTIQSKLLLIKCKSEETLQIIGINYIKNGYGNSVTVK